MAEDAILGQLHVLPPEACPLQNCVGRTLRQDVFAERDNPPFDRVCMDGIAISHSAFERGLRGFRIEASQAAGAPAVTLRDPVNAIEVMTGAMVPLGTDCIIPLEEYDLEGDVVHLKTQATARAFRNIQRRGEDSEPGVAMLASGVRLGAPEIATAASAGLAHLNVTRQSRVIAISTGDELIEPGRPILEYQVRRSNAYAIVAALRERGFSQVSDDHVPDDEGALTQRLLRHLSEQDVLVLSGGISKGKFDLVPQVLEKIGVQQVFRQVAQQPGRPLYFGSGPDGQAVFGLPGNPVSTLMCLVRYVVPALLRQSGAAQAPIQHMPLATPVKVGKASMAYFLPVTVQVDNRGAPSALPAPANGPGDFLALTRTHGFVELPPRSEPFPAGFVARFYRW